MMVLIEASQPLKITLHYNMLQLKIVKYSYTGVGESRKSGCFLCSSIPQKGHHGFEGTA